MFNEFSVHDEYQSLHTVRDLFPAALVPGAFYMSMSMNRSSPDM